MKTKTSFFRWAGTAAAGGLLLLFADGCITHPPGGQPQRQADTSKEMKTVHHRKHGITHPPGGNRDASKERPMMSAPPTSITHPGG